MLVVDGGHIQRDVLGDHPTAWRHRLGDVPLTCAPPLGLQPAILAIYLRHLAAALA